MVPAENVLLHAADLQERALLAVSLVSWLAPELSPSKGKVHSEDRLCLTALCILQGGREVSDFISYLKREATSTPVLQEEDKAKKSKKKAKEDL